MLLRCENNGRIRYAGAHEDLLIFRAATGRCDASPSTGIWASIVPDIEAGQIDETEVVLQRGDVLLLHTDGITEARNLAHVTFGLERLMQSFESVGARSVDDIRAHIIEAARCWGPEITDDRTLVVVRYVGAP